ncbi:MAG: PAS domain S-box protein [Chloroflexi bacterium]|jgi:PAS domain S-box-containing protein|nr:PAS domain S-box protein [Chloroflexota bacterium]MBT3668647.1 PAS domain S-box protein [Chloroflexota bacterium]MBT4002018.1 PAS domain S-box protein [Chloroflexota bacterium]MBT4304150.1 PAS domain S-box protein [Chloroflexota bacterium]MBT4533216.1 PAS domain S-box protein [Chloroflexota bacterium]
MIFKKNGNNSTVDYKKLIENTDDLIIQLNPKGIITYVNHIGEEIFGIPVKKIIGSSAFDFIHPDDRNTSIASFTNFVAQSGEKTIVETRLIGSTGEIFYFQWRVNSNYGNNGKIVSLNCIARNLTKLKMIESSLKESEDKFLTIVNNTQAILFTIDSDGIFTLSEGKSLAVLGLEPGQVVGDSAFKIYEDYPKITASLKEAMRGKAISGEIELGEIYFDIWYSPIFDANDKVDGVMGMAIDITERKKNEEKVKVQIKRLESIRLIENTVTSSVDLQLTLKVILEQVLELKASDAAVVYLYDKESNRLVNSAEVGFKNTLLDRINILSEKSLAGKAMIEKKSILVNKIEDTSFNYMNKKVLKREGFKLYIAVPLLTHDKMLGVLEAYSKNEFNPEEDWLGYLELVGSQAALALDKASTYNDLIESHEYLTNAYDETLEGWVKALELKDREIKGHAERVVDLTVKLAIKLGIEGEELIHIRRGALLHDVGKMGIPDEILHKPGSLTEEEWVIMRQHPIMANELLSKIEFLRPSIDIPYYHHEKWDGSGYPKGIKGEDIPIAARIFAIVDVWDALLWDRPYRAAWPKEKAFNYLKEQSGVHFDPRVAGTFLEMVQDRV